jgi:hypothetical protein
MKYILIFLISQSILLPLIAGLVRLRLIGRTYQPFFILILTGFLTEIISFIAIKWISGSNAVPSNINAFLEFTLILWQFYIWHHTKLHRRLFYCIWALCGLCWATENLFFWKITEFSPYFRFLASFVIVLLSVNKINFMITHDNRNLFRSPVFLICIGFIIYFIYKILYEWSFQVSLFGSTEISRTIIFWMAYVNVLANIIYAIAFLLIPAPQKFTLK